MYQMKNKVAWISGASSGIGEYVARAMHAQGAKVILSARRVDRLTALCKELGDGSAALAMDVTQTDSLSPIHDEAQKIFGPIDILVNNAGISQRGSVEETELEVDRRLFEVNYFGNVALTKAALPSMLERKSGKIVVVSSIAGKLGIPFRSTYCASKHALQGYYDALRAEISDRNVQVHMICPGYINTDISIHALNGKGEKHGVMDENQAKGMSPVKCAQFILSAIVNNKNEILIGKKESNAVLMRRIMPSMYYKFIEKRAREKRF